MDARARAHKEDAPARQTVCIVEVGAGPHCASELGRRANTPVMSRILTYDPSVGIGELADPISVLRCLQAYEASLATELSTLEGERHRCREYGRMYGSKAWKKPLETLNLKIISTENSLREIKFHINLFHSHVRGGAELCRRMAHQFGVPQHLMFQ